MRYPCLSGSHILIVEDEPIIALDMASALEDVGARVTLGTNLKDATALIERDGLAAAVLDHLLPDGDSIELCLRLKDRGVPFLIYSGYALEEGPCKDAPHLVKPASNEALLEKMEDLISAFRVAAKGGPDKC